MVSRRFGRLLQVLFSDRSRGDPVTGNLMARQAASIKRNPDWVYMVLLLSPGQLRIPWVNVHQVQTNIREQKITLARR
jgi:hypothetical protein